MYVIFIVNFFPTAEEVVQKLRGELQSNKAILSAEKINDSIIDFANQMMMILAYLIVIMPDKSSMKDIIEKLKLITLPQLHGKRKKADLDSDFDSDDEPKLKIPKKPKVSITDLILELDKSIKPHDCEIEISNIEWDELDVLDLDNCKTKIEQCDNHIRALEKESLSTFAKYGKCLKQVKTILKKGKQQTFANWSDKNLAISQREAQRYLMFYSLYCKRSDVIFSKLPFRWFVKHGVRITKYLDLK